MKKNSGTVYLIGAGPGDVDLITVKGKKLLETCDTVVYDALVNELLISRLPQKTKRIFVGKRGGKPSAKQDEINKIIVSEAKKGRSVARVKGGDPLVFGRGSEEMEYCTAEGIAYEVVPGITSAIAAPTYAGIPVTHRSISRSFAVATGHLQAGESADNLEIPRADTIVFLMAMENLPLIIEKLLADGWTKKTPAALIRNGTHPDQEILTGTLGTMVAKRDASGIKPPVAFVVGETVRFAKSLAWRKKLPLAGSRVAVLRTNEQSTELVESLTALGATVLPYPIISIVPRTSSFKNVKQSTLAIYTMIIFTSPNGAAIFMDELLARGIDARALAGKKIFAMGSGTAAVLKKYAIIVDAVPEKYVAEGLLGMLDADLVGENILIPRAAVAREILPETLMERGAQVTVLPVYDTVPNDSTNYTFRDGDYVLFTSSSTVEYFYADEARKKCVIHPVCIGDITANTLKNFTQQVPAVAENATIPALVATVCGVVKKNQTENKRQNSELFTTKRTKGTKSNK